MKQKQAAAESRDEALAQGLFRYISAKPCPQGHVGERYTLTRNCVVCIKARVEATRAREKEIFAAAKAAQVS